MSLYVRIPNVLSLLVVLPHSIFASLAKTHLPIVALVAMLFLRIVARLNSLPLWINLLWFAHEQAHPQMCSVLLGLVYGKLAKGIRYWSIVTAHAAISFAATHFEIQIANLPFSVIRFLDLLMPLIVIHTIPRPFFQFIVASGTVSQPEIAGRAHRSLCLT